jgi:hypothetical protein
MILSINRLLMSGYSPQAGMENARVYEEGVFVNPPFVLIFLGVCSGVQGALKAGC